MSNLQDVPYWQRPLFEELFRRVEELEQNTNSWAHARCWNGKEWIDPWPSPDTGPHKPMGDSAAQALAACQEYVWEQRWGMDPNAFANPVEFAKQAAYVKTQGEPATKEELLQAFGAEPTPSPEPEGFRITGPGKYVRRGGREAMVDREDEDNECGFRWHGRVLPTKTEGGCDDHWHDDGRWCSGTETSRDLVARIDEPEPAKRREWWCVRYDEDLGDIASYRTREACEEVAGRIRNGATVVRVIEAPTEAEIESAVQRAFEQYDKGCLWDEAFGETIRKLLGGGE